MAQLYIVCCVSRGVSQGLTCRFPRALGKDTSPLYPLADLYISVKYLTVNIQIGESVQRRGVLAYQGLTWMFHDSLYSSLALD